MTSSAPVNPRSARCAACRPFAAAFAGCIAFAWLPNTSRTPDANVPATPMAMFVSSGPSPRILLAAAAAPKTPAVPVMCQPIS